MGYIEGFFTALDTGKCESNSLYFKKAFIQLNLICLVDEKLIEKLAGTVEERNQQQTTESPSTQSSKGLPIL